MAVRKGKKARPAARTARARRPRAARTGIAAQLAEVRAQQAATAEILRAISASPSDVQPVFDAIVHAVARLFGRKAGLRTVEGGHLRRRARSYEPAPGEWHGADVEPLDRSTLIGRAVLEGRALQWADTLVDGAAALGMERMRSLAFRSIASAPLMLRGRAIGVISVSSPRPGALSDGEMTLLATFASQAVIAIENARLFHETREALERQTATSDILAVIAGSPSNVQPVFDAIAESGARLFAPATVGVNVLEGDRIHVRSGAGPLVTSEVRAYIDSHYPIPYDPKSIITAECIATGSVIEIPDTEAKGVNPRVTAQGRAIGFRSILQIPMIRDGKGIGVLGVLHPDRGYRFAPSQIELMRAFANQAVIAIENARLFNQTREALERQTATAEILRVISNSPGDVQPVFDAVASNACRLLDGLFAVVARKVDDMLHLVSHTATNKSADPMLKSLFPARITGEGAMGKAIAAGAPVCIEDVEQDPHYSENFRKGARKLGMRSMVNVPMLREGVSIGVITVSRAAAGPVSQHEMDLLKAFADQAAIAIENARLFNETKEALERQTATAEILKVIAGSPTDVQPVFDAIVQSVARLLPMCNAAINILEGDLIHLRATAGATSVPIETFAGVYPLRYDPVNLPNLASRAIVERRIVEVPDTESVGAPPSSQAVGRLGKFRSLTLVPLLRENQAIGSIAVTHPSAGFVLDHNQRGLLQTFADQAVIAIENVRLFNETKEALERQTATAEILKVIAGSTSDVQPVFEAIVSTCQRLFGGRAVTLVMPRGTEVYSAAFADDGNAIDQSSGFLQPWPLDRDSVAGLSILESRAVIVPDTGNVGDQFPRMKALALALGYRAVLCVPLLREGAAIGTIGILRATPGEFLEKEIALAKTFADQAVIAIENVRLFNETKEALERQKASAEILRVISGSLESTSPVFEAIVASGTRLFGARLVGINVLDPDGNVRMRAYHGPNREEYGAYMRDIARMGGGGGLRLRRRLAHFPDVEARDEVPEHVRDICRITGTRAVIFAPIISSGKGIGALWVGRDHVGPFSDKEIALLQTFADQAVIAIENVRLFNETKEALERQTATAEILKVIASSPSDVQPVFDAIVRAGVQLFENAAVAVARPEHGEMRLKAIDETDKDRAANWSIAFPFPISRDFMHAAAVLDCRMVEVADAAAEQEDFVIGRRNFLRTGYRAMTVVPMVRDGVAIGTISVVRAQPGALTERQKLMLQTFADQAVIAIENVRLFNELKEKSHQLEVASQHKSQFLASMSHELRTPLNAILGFNEMILGEVYGPVPPDMKEPVEDIQKSGKHLLGLINNVLDLAKIEAGRMELALSDFSVHDVVESVRATLRPLAEQKGLALEVGLPDDLPLAHGDAGRLRQCLMNLAGNSLKFTKQGKVALSVEQSGPASLLFTVSDTGIGIPQDKLGNLFTEFKQTDATIASEYGGTGLGLSITKKFVEMHGGRIWVESEVGRGSRFLFEIPLKAGA